MTQSNTALLRIIGQQPGEEGRANKYEPGHCQLIRDMAQDGQFPENWCARIGIHMETMRNWCREHPEFLEAVRVARVLLTDYWTQKAREMAITPASATLKPSERVLVEILRKRFPELWGLDPPVSVWSFMMDAEPSKAVAGDPGPGLPKTKDEIEARLAELQARRKEGET
jgi:hypothetical protein